MSQRLAGKVALITGGARGIGEATARRFAAEGARVIIADILDDLGEALARTIGKTAAFVHLDVAKRSDWDAAVSATELRFGPISILVNNAGIAGEGAMLTDETDANYERIVGINQSSVFHGIRSVVPSMLRASGGSIVNVSSTAGLVGWPGLGAYSATKHAVVGLTKSAALELGRSGIRVNCIHPGVVDTALTSGVSGDVRGILDQLIANLALPRMGQPDEIASAILFFASEDARFCTGASLVVDGGWTAI